MPDRPQEGQALPSVHWDAVDKLAAAFYPGMTAADGYVKARLVEKDQAVDANSTDSLAIDGSFCDYVRTQTLQRPSPFFLTTYPCRWRARFMLET
jgi:hypothetical protein